MSGGLKAAGLQCQERAAEQTKITPWTISTSEKTIKFPFFTILPTSAVNVRQQSFLPSSDLEQFIAERGTSLCVPHCHTLLQLGGTSNSQNLNDQKSLFFQSKTSPEKMGASCGI